MTIDPRLQQIHTELRRSIATQAAKKIKVITLGAGCTGKSDLPRLQAESSTDSFVQTLVLLSEPHPHQHQTRQE